MFTLNGCCLTKYQSGVINVCFCKQDPSIIKGNVYSPQGNRSSGAVVRLTEVNPITKQKNTIGYTVTNSEGEYLFVVEVNPYMCYEVNVYGGNVSA